MGHRSQRKPSPPAPRPMTSQEILFGFAKDTAEWTLVIVIGHVALGFWMLTWPESEVRTWGLWGAFGGAAYFTLSCYDSLRAYGMRPLFDRRKRRVESTAVAERAGADHAND